MNVYIAFVIYFLLWEKINAIDDVHFVASLDGLIIGEKFTSIRELFAFVNEIEMFLWKAVFSRNNTFESVDW